MPKKQKKPMSLEDLGKLSLKDFEKELDKKENIKSDLKQMKFQIGTDEKEEDETKT